MGKDGLGEIENLTATTYIIDAVVEYKDAIVKTEIESEKNEKPEKMSAAEKYKGYDFVGSAGKKLLEALQSGKKKAIEFLGKSKAFINNDIYQTLVRAEERNKRMKENAEEIKEKAKSAIEYVKETPERIDKAILEKQMAHARDKFEKRKNRQTFKSKAEDLKNVIAYKIKNWRENKKEDFAIMLETTKVYASLVKDKAIKDYEHLGIQTAIGVGAVKKFGRDTKENAGAMVGKAKDSVVNAALAAAGAVVAKKDDVKTNAKKVAFKGTQGLRSVLNIAAEAAMTSVDKLDRKLAEQEKEILKEAPDKDAGAR